MDVLLSKGFNLLWHLYAFSASSLEASSILSPNERVAPITVVLTSELGSNTLHLIGIKYSFCSNCNAIVFE